MSVAPITESRLSPFFRSVFFPVESYPDYLRLEPLFQLQARIDQEYAGSGAPTVFAGHCVVCNRVSRFRVDHSRLTAAGFLNWREQLECQSCGFNNRLRASIQIIRKILRERCPAAVYITEQASRLYRRLKQEIPSLSGSEYLGDSLLPGTSRWIIGDGLSIRKIRHETLTRLSFPDHRFDFIISLDVLEHIGDYRRALRECHRCLQTGGAILISVPFSANLPVNRVRAVVEGSGVIRHLLEPEYHGDPLRKGRCLCFHNFGWELLEDMKQAGFANVRVILAWSLKYACPGCGSVFLTGEK